MNGAHQSSNGGPLDAVRVPKSAELVSAYLRRRIATGVIPDGDTIPSESVLAEQFGVSRPTLREALRVLEAQGLITVKRGTRGGAKVSAPDGRVAAEATALVLQHRGVTMSDVYEARTLIDPTCAGLLATRRTDSDIEKLRAAIADAEQALDDPATGVRLQQEFHALIVDLAGNETMRVLTGMVLRIIDVAAYSKVERDAGTPSEITAMHVGHKHHRLLVDLIEAGDAEGAERLWRRHAKETADYLQDGPTALTVVELLT